MKPEARQYEQTAIEVVQSNLPPPVVTFTGPGNVWRLEQDYGYQDGANLITVPAGFQFDLASIPRIFWGLIAPFELSIVAPLLHDFLYKNGGNPAVGTIEPPRVYTRNEADQLFRRVMEIEGVPAWRRHPAYYAVRAFGGRAWHG
jgi:hypothetical protein